MSRRIEVLRFLAFGAISFLLLGNSATAQSRQSGEIRGTVMDQTGAVIPDVEVTITNVLTGVSLSTKTNAAGVYEAPSVPPGDYTVTFLKEGFGRFSRSGITLHVETITIDAALQLGSTSNAIDVKAEVPLIQTENAEQSTYLPERTVTSVPNLGRSYYNLMVLMPGVNGGTGAADANGANVGVNGNAGAQYNWQIDGAVAMLSVNQNPDRMRPPLDSIEEVKFSTSNFGAEYGNGLAVFNATTKSGTNQFHGSLFEFDQNDKFDARNFFSQDKTPLRWNQFGGTVGGPIKHDKAFFFFSYQKETDVESSPAYTTAPSAAMRAGDFSDPTFQTIYDPYSAKLVNGLYVRTPLPGNMVPQNRIDPVALNVQSYYPTANLPGMVNNYYWVDRETAPIEWFTGKVDYNLSSNHRLTASFLRADSNAVHDTVECALDCGYYHYHEYQSSLTDVWTARPNLVGEFRFGLSYENEFVHVASEGQGYGAKLGLNNLAANLFPAFTVSGSVAPDQIGENNTPAIDDEVIWSPSANFTWVQGRHIVKFGGQFDRWLANGGWPTQDPGSFDFNGTFTLNPADPNSAGEGYADFLYGLPDSWNQYAYADTGGRTWSAQGFLQDEYKIRPNLTLSIGLRYIRQAGWSEVRNRFANLSFDVINPATNAPPALCYGGQKGCSALENPVNFFAPRFGFAWSPRKNWSVRGGYGLYNLLRGAYAYGNGLGTGWATQGYAQVTDQVTPIFTLQQGPPSPVYPTAAQRTPDLLNGQDVNYSPPNLPMAYSQQYRLDVQYQIGSGLLIDLAYVGNKALHVPFTRDMNQVPVSLLGPGDAQLNRPYPIYGQISATTTLDIQNYNALQARIKRQFSSGLMLEANYSYAKAMDTMTIAGYGNAPATWQNSYDPMADYGPSSIDMRQTFTGYAVYQLPAGKGKAFLNRGGALDAVLGGWELASTFQFHTGLPFTPVMDGNRSGALSGDWRPNRLGAGTLANPSINLWFDPSAFTQPLPFTFGNSGRDILYGPGFEDVDLSLSKSFSIPRLGERTKLQFRAESFDFLNSANFRKPNANIGNDAVGTITSSSTNRRIQLGARITF